MSTAQKAQETKSQNKQEEKKNKIQVSSTKQSLSFYVYLAKKFLQNEPEVELSGLGNAINTVVSCAEILKNQGLANIKKIETSTVEVQNTNKPNKPIQKAKIQIFITKSENFDKLMQEAEERKKKKEEEKKEEKETKAE